MDKVLQTNQSYPNKNEKPWNKHFYFFLPNMSRFAHFRDQLKTNLKIARGKSWFFQYKKFTQKFMWAYFEINIRSGEVNTTKKIIDLLEVNTTKKKSLISLNVLRNFPWFPTMFMIFFVFSFDKLLVFFN